jgi:hypothetical protein
VRGSEADRPRIHGLQIHSPGESGRRPAVRPVIIRVAHARPRLRRGLRIAAGSALMLSPRFSTPRAPWTGRGASGRAVGGASRASSRRMRRRREVRAPSRRASSLERALQRERPCAATSCRRGIFMPTARHGAARISARAPRKMRAPRVSLGTGAGLDGRWCADRRSERSSPASSHRRGDLDDLVGHLLVAREALLGLLREDRPTFEAHLEHTAVTADEVELQLFVGERGLQFGDQTGRLREVVSTAAVFDSDLHWGLLGG